MDLAAAQPWSFLPAASTRLSLGDGSFAPARALPGASGIYIAMASGDVDGDGDVDLVAATADTGTLFENIDGQGEFVACSPFPLNDVAGLLLEDLDQDGRADLIEVVGIPAAALTYLSHGSGFTPTSRVDLSPFGNPRDLVLRDLSGDGLPDLARVTYLDGTVDFFEGQGDGTFGGAVQAVPPVRNEVGAAILDVDLDGDSDVVIQRAGQLLVAENTAGSTFAVPVPLAHGGASTFLTVFGAVDVDGDGLRDLTVRTQPGFDAEWMKNRGDGTFGAPQALGLVLDGFRVTAYVDLTGDGRLDHVDLGFSAQEPAPLRVWINELPLQPTPFGTPLQPNLPAGSASLVTTYSPRDGLLDDLVTGSVQGGAGSLEAVGSLEFEAFASSPVGFLQPGHIEPIDLEGDGKELLVEGWPGIFFPGSLRIIDPRSDSAPLILDSNASFDDLRVIDLAADGDEDFTVTRANVGTQQFDTLLGENDGGVISLRILAQGERGMAVQVDDDGIPDLVLAGLDPMTTSGLRWRRGQPDGSFGGAQTLFTSSGPVDLKRMRRVDLDGDQIDDLLLVVDGRLEVALGQGGAASFQAPVTVPIALDPDLSWFAAEDVDGDGMLDLLVNHGLQPQTRRTELFLGAGGLLYAAPIQLSVPDTSPDLPALADLEGDGDLDLVVADQGFVWLLENRTIARVGAALCGEATTNSTGRSGRLVGTGELSTTSTNLTLRGDRLPPGAPGIFVAARGLGPGQSVFGSEGLLCLLGPIGRFDAPGQIRASDGTGVLTLVLDPSSIATPTGPVSAVVGESWYFQAWHRDVAGGSATSNLTSALELGF